MKLSNAPKKKVQINEANHCSNGYNNALDKRDFKNNLID